MSDITAQTYTPRAPTVVDVVAETRRIAEQLLRGNPLRNAVTRSGLMRWIGNYSTGGWLWIGEFFPADPNQHDAYGNVKGQQAISWTRDDPIGSTVIVAYDWAPEVGVPLRQKIIMNDADGKRIYQEGNHGGIAYPVYNVPMGRTSLVTNRTTDGVECAGRGSVLGNTLSWIAHIQPMPLWPVQGATGFANVNVPLPTAAAASTVRVSYYMEIVIGSKTKVTPTLSMGPGAAYVSGTIDLADAWTAEENDYAVINFHAWLSAGAAGSNGFMADVVTCQYFAT